MKRVNAILLAAVLLFSTMACLPSSASLFWPDKEEDFTYVIADNEATVTGYAGKGGSHGSVVIPETLGGAPVTAIADGAFESITMIYSIVLPDNLRTIGNAAFRGCRFLQGVVFPEGLITIGDEAFLGCAWLKSLNIPETVTHIGSGAFIDCGMLETITVAKGNSVYRSEGDCLIETKTDTLLRGCANSVIPEGVKTIGAGAFYGSIWLEHITIPETVTAIGDEAFLYSGLYEIVIPKSVNSIGRSAFGFLDRLKSVTVEKGNTFYHTEGNCLIETKTGVLLKGCPYSVIPNGVKAIADHAFADVSNLSSVVIPNGVTEIGAYAFASCHDLSGVIIPDSVTKIGERAFSDCNLRKIYIPKGVTEMGAKAFAGPDLENIYCGADAKPKGWSDTWLGNQTNSEYLTVHWGAERPVPSSGDLNKDGVINAKDYLLLKRYCLGSLALTEAQLAVADVNGDGKINATDYMLVKRAVLGSYVIQ